MSMWAEVMVMASSHKNPREYVHIETVTRAVRESDLTCQYNTYRYYWNSYGNKTGMPSGWIDVGRPLRKPVVKGKLRMG